MKIQHPFERLGAEPIKSVRFHDLLNNPATKGEEVVTILVEFESGAECTVLFPDEWHGLSVTQKDAITNAGNPPPFSAEYKP